MTGVAEPTTFTEALAATTAEQAGSEAEGTAENSVEGTATEAATPVTFKVKVDGQEVEVTQDELLSGYSRTADYTKKTQELAVERQRLTQAEQLQEALEADPQGTLARLAQHFQVDSLEAGETPELDPLEKDVLELKSFAEQQREAQFQAEINTEISRIQADYNDPDLDPNVLLQHAVDREIGNLDAAYRDLKFADLHSAAEEQRKAKLAADDAAAEEAKRAASIVEGGSNRSTGTKPIAGDRPKTVLEAWNAAEQELLA